MDPACRSNLGFWGVGGTSSIPILRPPCPEGGTVTPGTGGPTEPRTGPASRRMPGAAGRGAAGAGRCCWGEGL